MGNCCDGDEYPDGGRNVSYQTIGSNGAAYQYNAYQPQPPVMQQRVVSYGTAQPAYGYAQAQQNQRMAAATAAGMMAGAAMAGATMAPGPMGMNRGMMPSVGPGMVMGPGITTVRAGGGLMGQQTIVQRDMMGDSRVVQRDMFGDRTEIDRDFMGNTRVQRSDMFGDRQTVQTDMFGDRREVDVNAFTGERREVDYNAFTGETRIVERDAFGDTMVVERDAFGDTFVDPNF